MPKIGLNKCEDIINKNRKAKGYKKQYAKSKRR